MADSNVDAKTPEIVFFDIETSVPNRAGLGQQRKFWVLEFGAMVVCPLKLIEIESYSTIVRPGDLSVVALTSTRPDGITRESVSNAPSFEQVADKIFEILNGRIWAGHNIGRFDCHRIKEAFAEIGCPAPQPVGVIDSLGVLSDKFGKRAGDMKMATLANYFGLGQQKHRSLDDVRMNLEVLKSCATVLLLESNLPNVLGNKWQYDSSIVTTRSRYNNEDNKRRSWSYREEPNTRKSPPRTVGHQRSVPYLARARLRKITDTVKSILCRAQSSRCINNFIKHSHSILG